VGGIPSPRFGKKVSFQKFFYFVGVPGHSRLNPHLPQIAFYDEPALVGEGATLKGLGLTRDGAPRRRVELCCVRCYCPYHHVRLLWNFYYGILLLTFALYSPMMLPMKRAAAIDLAFGLCPGLAATKLAIIVGLGLGQPQETEAQVCAT